MTTDYVSVTVSAEEATYFHRYMVMINGEVPVELILVTLTDVAPTLLLFEECVVLIHGKTIGTEKVVFAGFTYFHRP